MVVARFCLVEFEEEFFEFGPVEVCRGGQGGNFFEVMQVHDCILKKLFKSVFFNLASQIQIVEILLLQKYIFFVFLRFSDLYLIFHHQTQTSLSLKTKTVGKPGVVLYFPGVNKLHPLPGTASLALPLFS